MPISNACEAEINIEEKLGALMLGYLRIVRKEVLV